MPLCGGEIGIHPSLYNTIAGTEPAPRHGPACRTACLCAAEAPRNHAILLVSVPIFSIQIRTTSPALRNSPRAAPTPAGVPVRIRSPGCSVMPLDNWAICSARLKIMCLLLESCLRTSFTHSLRPRLCGSPMSSAGTIHGPSGQEPSKVLCLVQSDLNGEVSLMLARRPRSRAERSLAAVYPATEMSALSC